MAAVAAAPLAGRVETTRAVAWILLAFLAVALVGSPFDYADSENTRYLLPVLRAADPHLFAGDTVVDAITRFRSAFYELLALGVRLIHVDPDSIPAIFLGIYVLVRSALACTLFLFVRSLRGTTAAFAFTAALCSLTKVVPLGGIAVFTPKLTHVEVAMVLCVAALAVLFQGRLLFFWILMSAAVFVHPLVTLHLAIIMLPVLYRFSRPAGLREVGGAVLFGSACTAYFLWMAPPPMSRLEQEIFLASKGSMAHVSLLSQPALGWIMAASVLAILVLGSRRLFPPGHNIRLLANTVVWGAFAALFLSGMEVFTASYRLAQVQPMRMFLWVWLLALVLLAFVTVEALRSRFGLGVLLTTTCVFVILESLWALIFAFIVAVLLAVDAPLVRKYGPPAVDRMLGKLAAVSLAGPLVVWLISSRLPFASLHDPGLLAPCALLTFCVLSTNRRFRTPLVYAAVTLAVLAVCVHRWEYKASRADTAWTNVREWAEQHTPISARFVIPNESDGFRLIARRTAINEPMSALAWVAPLEHQRNQRLVDSASQICSASECDIPALLQFARREHANYLIVRQDTDASTPAPLARFGDYSVLSVPDDPRSLP